jgi:dihydrofolate reductase
MADQGPFTCHVFIGTSLDGFIARTNGDLEWLTSRGEAAGEYGFQEFIDGIDTVAMGRVTYGNWLSLGTDQWPFHGKHVAVLSTRLDADDDRASPSTGTWTSCSRASPTGGPRASTSTEGGSSGSSCTLA